MARRLTVGLQLLPPGTGWLAGLCAAALVQIGLGMAGLIAIALGAEWQQPTAVQDWQRAVQVFALGVLAAYLLLGASRDARLAYMGTFYLLLALFFAHPPSRALAGVLPAAPARIVELLRSAPVDAFTPAIAWLFVREFPRGLESRASIVLVRFAIQVSVAAALVLIAINLAIGIRGSAGVLDVFDRNAPFGHYWTVVFGLLLPTLLFIPWRTRHAPVDERRRVGLFAVSLGLLAVFPVSLAVIPPWFPRLSEQVLGELGARVLVPVNLLMILAMAATTAYAVAARRIFDVRTVLRKAAQYSLARIVVGALAAIPLLALVAGLYRTRNQPLSELFVGPQWLWLLACVVAFAVVLRVRRRVMLSVDRLFFREPYDPTAVLDSIMERSTRSGPLHQWASEALADLEAALHLESVGLLVASPGREEFRPVVGALRRLPANSAIAASLQQRDRPLSVELEKPGDELRSFGADDRIWLADAGIELLVPLVAAERELIGIMTLGPKRSELPFSREDLRLLHAFGGAAAAGLENRLLREAPRLKRVPAASEERASECGECGHIDRPGIETCTACGGRTVPGRLPLDLFGKFHLLERVGEGGMGVVYRANDVALGRDVALKTLPVTTPEDAGRLRREARAMAAITHPNLALILGVEAWEGTPVLVLEYLAGGTLEDRLAHARLTLRDALELTHTLASVLHRAHRAGILHRDVKPSNIGFNGDGIPKLLDFGLARIAQSAPSGRAAAFDGARSETGFAGTPLYMCPEAFAAERPYVGFDLWSLAVVAFEAASGRHPFEREGATESMEAIRKGWSDEVRAMLPAGSEAALSFFERALAADPSRRPSSASEMADSARAALAALESLAA